MKFIIFGKKLLFEPKLVPSIATLLGFVILLTLSGWQIHRLNWKENLISERVDRFERESSNLKSFKTPSNHEFRKVRINGKFLNDKEMFMPALSKNGNNGFHILVPISDEKENFFIFDTGWVPTKKKNQFLRRNNLDSSFSVKEAVIRLPGRKGKFQPDNEPQNNFWFFVDTKQMSEFTSLNFEKTFYLEAVNNGPNGFPLGSQSRIYIRNNHLQYAITWFLIACGLLGVYLTSSLSVTKK
tara:strand:- start:2573 stop:3295 length:723 start_codon:yes stop_codon:yes gene_type:complete